LIYSARLVPVMARSLGLLALASARAGARAYRHMTRISRGSTMRPGPETPLWNELAKQTRALLRRRGEKANLARFLGLPRQRVHEFLRAGCAMPDAERTLQLLIWVEARRRGVRLS